ETQVQEAEWNQLQELMLSAIPEEHCEWVSKELPYINHPILSKRLTLLGKEAKTVTGSLSGDSRAKIDRWAGTVAAVRNELTHRRSADDTVPGGVLHWLAESVYQVLRVCLLKECVTSDVFDRLAASQGHPELEAFVSAAIAEAREIVRRRRG
ncbi:MAG: HEPN domain-containing protein, partial [Pyrinomonadaceae bacterium]